jgi:hypothetical protein
MCVPAFEAVAPGKDRRSCEETFGMLDFIQQRVGGVELGCVYGLIARYVRSERNR